MLSSTLNEKTTGISPSPTKTIKEETLSSYFNLHNEGFLSPCEAAHSKLRIESASSNMNFYNSYPNNHHTRPGSSSARRQWRPLLDADESATPLSWLSALFSRRKKKQITQSPHACNEGKCDPFSAASPEWEAPRASSWEQLSSWEKPASSLSNLFLSEHHRPSDVDMQQLRLAIAVQAATELHPKQENSRKGKLQWVKSLIGVKWAIKLRRGMRKKRVAEQGRGDGEDDDGGSTMSAPSWSARGSDYSLQNGQIKAGQDRAFHSQRELGATWSSPYSPLLQSYGSLKHNRKLRPSHHIGGHNGLLRFHLTPIKIGSKRPRSYHPLIPKSSPSHPYDNTITQLNVSRFYSDSDV